MGYTVLEIADRVRDEADAYKFLEELRWKGTPRCCHCTGTNVRYLKPTNGHTRRTSSGSVSQRRVWQCRDCRRQFSVLTGTVMHGTKVPVRIWVMCIFEMCASKNGVAAREIERKYGVCCRTAWHLLHRIREAMRGDLLVEAMQGTIVADETFIGGKERFRHADKRTNLGSGRQGKTAVLTLIDKVSGEARSRVISDVSGATLEKVIAEQVRMNFSILYTDEWAGYNALGQKFMQHHSVNHAHDEYARYIPGQVITINQAENFFSQLKRSLDGTHHHVSVEHLSRYLAEFDFRYTTKKLSDTERMARLMNYVSGKRLTYKRISA